MTPQIFFRAPIGNKNEIIGYLQLVIYEPLKVPQIEFEIDEAHRNKGIMTKELPKYLDLCKKEGYHTLIANVENDNYASMRVLEKCGFVRIKSFDDIHSYCIDLRLTKKQMLRGLELLTKKGKICNSEKSF